MISLSTIMALRLKMSDKRVKNVSVERASRHRFKYIKTPYMNNGLYIDFKDAIEYKEAYYIWV